jgi:hypothetical protein
MGSVDTMGAVEALLAKQEITEVVMRYCRGVDRMDRSMVRACYHDDAVDRHGSFSGTADEYVTWVFRILERYSSTFHFVGNVLVEPSGPAVARCETYGIAHHRGDPSVPAANLITGFRFIDRFERRGDGPWLIADRLALTEWVQVEDPAMRWPIGERLPTGARDRSDPVYGPL